MNRYILKSVLATVSLMLADTLVIAGTVYADTKEQAMNVYKEILESGYEYEEEDFYIPERFALALIDNDDIPELLFPAGWILSYENGQIKEWANGYECNYIEGYYERTGEVKRVGGIYTGSIGDSENLDNDENWHESIEYYDSIREEGTLYDGTLNGFTKNGRYYLLTYMHGTFSGGYERVVYTYYDTGEEIVFERGERDPNSAGSGSAGSAWSFFSEVSKEEYDALYQDSIGNVPYTEIEYIQNTSANRNTIFSDNSTGGTNNTNPQARGFKHSLDYYATKSSTTYNPELAHDLMKLAWDTYGPNTTKDSHNVGSEDDIKKDYRSLGFSGNYYSKNYSRWEYFEDYCGFSFASKESDNGGKIVVVSVRGTVGGIFPTPSPEWVSDLLSPVPSINTIGWHQGFYKPACEILASLESKGLVNIGNTKYFISGHSRGAGVANVLSVLLLNKGVIKENLYDYNFACPDVRHEIASVDWTASGKFNSIFNINAANDLVGVVPGILGDTVDNMTRSASWSPWIGKLPYVWGKYGRTYFYSFDWNSNQRSVVHVWEFVHDQGSNNPHQPELYLKYLKQLNAVSSFKSYAQMKLQNVANEVKAFWAFCPVDMSLVDNNGNNIVAVINGKVKYYNNYGMDDAVVLTDGDVKAFFVNPSINCSVTLTGTGTGNMTFVSGMTKLYGQELKSEKAFTNIKLAGNKKFISEGLVSQSTNQLKLFTVNGNGKKEAEVNTNGTETKIVNTQPNTQPQLKDTQPSQQEKKEEIITSPVLNELITINYTPRKLKAKAKKKKITVSWKKIKKTKKTKTLLKQIHGIEVQYSTDPGFPVESSVKVPLGKKKTKLVLKGLQPKTQYFVRVRYTDGAGGYSNWSAVKAFKTK